MGFGLRTRDLDGFGTIGSGFDLKLTREDAQGYRMIII